MKTTKMENGKSAAKLLNSKSTEKVQRLSHTGVDSKQSRSAQPMKWSKKFNLNSCIRCGKDNSPHICHGLCSKCYDKVRGVEKRRKRSQNPEAKERFRVQCLEWKARNPARIQQYSLDYYEAKRLEVLTKKNESNHGGNYLSVLVRDKFSCRRCGKHPIFLVHHKCPGKHDKDLQVSLCVQCHVYLHRSKSLSTAERNDYFV